MAANTSDEFIDRLCDALRVDASLCRDDEADSARTLLTAADTLHAVRSERNMLAYEKGGHTLWKRYTGEK